MSGSIGQAKYDGWNGVVGVAGMGEFGIVWDSAVYGDEEPWWI